MCVRVATLPVPSSCSLSEPEHRAVKDARNETINLLYDTNLVSKTENCSSLADFVFFFNRTISVFKNSGNKTEESYFYLLAFRP